METAELKNLVEQNRFTTENTNGDLDDETIMSLNQALLMNILIYNPHTEEDALEAIKVESDRLINKL